MVYRVTCTECVKNGLAKPGTYNGETSSEHITLLNNMDQTSFIIKHWANIHVDMIRHVFSFEVVQRSRVTLSRMLHEALLIEKEGCVLFQSTDKTGF